jgi:hypothetical protein
MRPLVGSDAAVRIIDVRLFDDGHGVASGGWYEERLSAST